MRITRWPRTKPLSCLRKSMRLAVLKLSFLVRANRRVFFPSQRKPSAAATEVLSQWLPRAFKIGV